MNRILVFEPDAVQCAHYREALESRGYWVVSVTDPAAGIEICGRQLFHVCVWNVGSAAESAWISQIKTLRPMTSVIVNSAISDPAFIVACMRAGGSNFLPKTGTTEQLVQTVSETLAWTVPEPVEASEIDFPFPEFIGRHPRILEIFQLILNIRHSDATVLITGESGTGKEVVAKAIHVLSNRKRGALVAVNCAAIPASLLESELFGHMKGAFTGATQNRTGRFQMAGNGTLFLDEIGDLSFDLQAKLLRALQNRTYEPVGSHHSLALEARVIAATNQDLESAVSQKKFREDLYYRLNVIPIYLPALRTRKTDIPLLARFFLERYCAENKKEFVGISEEAMRVLVAYHWPGNVRELQNLIERVVVLKRSAGIIELRDFPSNHFKNVRLDRFVANVSLPEEGLDFNEAVNEFENELILQALQKTEGNKNRAASLLNLNRTTLVEKLKRKGLKICP